ncbi:MAG TPA: hypothetical protein VMK65_06880 [Longimicrobiales bacterium]|nr:hypothetical protein [Longimicrobiales bacterium]
MATTPNEQFWEQAHLDDSDEHPLERELADRMDAVHRYGSLISDAEANGNDEMAALLLRQLAREDEACRRLRGALERLRAGGGP